jgi:hypothetical protein
LCINIKINVYITISAKLKILSKHFRSFTWQTFLFQMNRLLYLRFSSLLEHTLLALNVYIYNYIVLKLIFKPRYDILLMQNTIYS